MKKVVILVVLAALSACEAKPIKQSYEQRLLSGVSNLKYEVVSVSDDAVLVEVNFNYHLNNYRDNFEYICLIGSPRGGAQKKIECNIDGRAGEVSLRKEIKLKKPYLPIVCAVDRTTGERKCPNAGKLVDVRQPIELIVQVGMLGKGKYAGVSPVAKTSVMSIVVINEGNDSK